MTQSTEHSQASRKNTSSVTRVASPSQVFAAHHGHLATQAVFARVKKLTFSTTLVLVTAHGIPGMDKLIAVRESFVRPRIRPSVPGPDPGAFSGLLNTRSGRRLPGTDRREQVKCCAPRDTLRHLETWIEQ